MGITWSKVTYLYRSKWGHPCGNSDWTKILLSIRSRSDGFNPNGVASCNNYLHFHWWPVRLSLSSISLSLYHDIESEVRVPTVCWRVTFWAEPLILWRENGSKGWNSVQKRRRGSNFFFFFFFFLVIFYSKSRTKLGYWWLTTGDMMQSCLVGISVLPEPGVREYQLQWRGLTGQADKDLKSWRVLHKQRGLQVRLLWSGDHRGEIIIKGRWVQGGVTQPCKRVRIIWGNRIYEFH